MGKFKELFKVKENFPQLFLENFDYENFGDKLGKQLKRLCSTFKSKKCHQFRIFNRERKTYYVSARVSVLLNGQFSTVWFWVRLFKKYLKFDQKDANRSNQNQNKEEINNPLNSTFQSTNSAQKQTYEGINDSLNWTVQSIKVPQNQIDAEINILFDLRDELANSTQNQRDEVIDASNNFIVQSKIFPQYKHNEKINDSSSFIIQWKNQTQNQNENLKLNLPIIIFFICLSRFFFWNHIFFNTKNK